MSVVFLSSSVAACATPHHAKDVAKKKHKRHDDTGYGLYSSGNVNNRILRHGQKVMGSAALGEY